MAVLSIDNSINNSKFYCIYKEKNEEILFSYLDVHSLISYNHTNKFFCDSSKTQLSDLLKKTFISKFGAFTQFEATHLRLTAKKIMDHLKISKYVGINYTNFYSNYFNSYEEVIEYFQKNITINNERNKEVVLKDDNKKSLNQLPEELCYFTNIRKYIEDINKENSSFPNKLFIFDKNNPKSFSDPFKGLSFLEKLKLKFKCYQHFEKASRMKQIKSIREDYKYIFRELLHEAESTYNLQDLYNACVRAKTLQKEIRNLGIGYHAHNHTFNEYKKSLSFVEQIFFEALPFACRYPRFFQNFPICSLIISWIVSHFFSFDDSFTTTLLTLSDVNFFKNDIELELMPEKPFVLSVEFQTHQDFTGKIIFTLEKKYNEQDSVNHFLFLCGEKGKSSKIFLQRIWQDEKGNDYDEGRDHEPKALKNRALCFSFHHPLYDIEKRPLSIALYQIAIEIFLREPEKQLFLLFPHRRWDVIDDSSIHAPKQKKLIQKIRGAHFLMIVFKNEHNHVISIQKLDKNDNEPVSQENRVNFVDSLLNHSSNSERWNVGGTLNFLANRQHPFLKGSDPLLPKYIVRDLSKFEKA
jgi:hypothetical protein